jgi:hypothetical protein
MNVDERPDVLLDALATLPTHAPRPSRDTRTRARCHAAMRPAAATRPQPPRRTSPHILDRLLPAAFVVYVLVTVAEALNIVSRTLVP